MNMKLWCLLLTCVLLNSAMHGTEKRTVPKFFKTIKPALEAQLSPVVQWVKQNAESLRQHIFYTDYFENLTGYIVDINNDGKKEYVFIDYQGRLHCLLIHIIAEDEKGLCYREMPYEPLHIGSWESPYSDLFVEAQGKIYMCTTDYDNYQNQTRDIYLWEKDTISFACDKFWIQQQRDLFNSLYKQGLYDRAYLLLNEFEKKCRHNIDPQTDLWLRSDISLAAIKKGNPRHALAIIKSIQEDTAFAHASPALKKAVKTNKSLADEEIEKGACSSKGTYNYDWLLSYGQELLGFDSRMNALLAAVVPTIVPAARYIRGNGDEFDWKDEIKMHFCGQFYGGVEVSEHRYIVCTGHMPHSVNKGFLWCDVKEKVGIVAITGNPICVTSRSVDWEEIPAEFYNSFKKWLLGLQKEDKDTTSLTCALFYDRQGTPFPLQTT